VNAVSAMSDASFGWATYVARSYHAAHAHKKMATVARLTGQGGAAVWKNQRASPEGTL